MFTVLNSESLWIGTDFEKDLMRSGDILDSQNISIKYKVKDQLGRMDRQRNYSGTCGKCRKSSGASQAVRNTCRQEKSGAGTFCDSKMIRYFL